MEVSQLVRLEEDGLQRGVRVLRGILDDVGHQTDGILGQGRHQDAEAVLLVSDAAKMKLALCHGKPSGRCVAPEGGELETGGCIVVRSSSSRSGDDGRVLILHVVLNAGSPLL